MKFPYLIETRRILWYDVVCWGYWWGMTEAQVDLLLMDQPTVTYKKNKSKTKDSKSAPSAKKVKQAEKDWLNKYGNGEKPKLNINLGAFSFGAPESK